MAAYSNKVHIKSMFGVLRIRNIEHDHLVVISSLRNQLQPHLTSMDSVTDVLCI